MPRSTAKLVRLLVWLLAPQLNSVWADKGYLTSGTWHWVYDTVNWHHWVGKMVVWQKWDLTLKPFCCGHPDNERIFFVRFRNLYTLLYFLSWPVEQNWKLIYIILQSSIKILFRTEVEIWLNIWHRWLQSRFGSWLPKDLAPASAGRLLAMFTGCTTWHCTLDSHWTLDSEQWTTIVCTVNIEQVVHKDVEWI